MNLKLRLYKDCSVKKFPNLKAYISVNFSHILKNFVPQKLHIFIAFQRCALYYCVFSFLVKSIPQSYYL